MIIFCTCLVRERSGSVLECLTRERGAAGLSLTGITALWSLSKTHYPSLVLVQPRRVRPCLNERLLMGCKESNQTNKQTCLVTNESTTYLDSSPNVLGGRARFCVGIGITEGLNSKGVCNETPENQSD